MPTPTFEPLATVTLAAGASSITFSSIPATFRDIFYVISGNLVTDTDTNTFLRFNSDTGSNYTRIFIFNHASVGQSVSSTQTRVQPWLADAKQSIATGSVMDYSATDKHKMVLVRFNEIAGGQILAPTRWADTSAITTMEFSSTNNFATGTTISIYGIEA